MIIHNSTHFSRVRYVRNNKPSFESEPATFFWRRSIGENLRDRRSGLDYSRGLMYFSEMILAGYNTLDNHQFLLHYCTEDLEIWVNENCEACVNREYIDAFKARYGGAKAQLLTFESIDDAALFKLTWMQ